MESIKNVQETCLEDPGNGKCVVAWDEVKELSATTSHVRGRKKECDLLVALGISFETLI